MLLIREFFRNESVCLRFGWDAYLWIEDKVSKSEAIESDDEIKITYAIVAKWLYELSEYCLLKSGL